MWTYGKLMVTSGRGLFSEQVECMWQQKMALPDHYYDAILLVRDTEKDISAGTNLAETFHSRLRADRELQGRKNYNNTVMRIEMGAWRYNWGIQHAVYRDAVYQSDEEGSHRAPRRRILSSDPGMDLTALQLSALYKKSTVARMTDMVRLF